MTLSNDKGIIDIPSHRSVDETVATLQQLLREKGVTLFAVIDHSGEAEKLMLATPSIAIDLPLKILVSEDSSHKVWISYNSPAYLQERHGFPIELLQNIGAVEKLAAQAAE